jgi:chorismate mutase / prephenate dehydratase
MSIDNLRKQIDELDSRIVKLISERMVITRDIGKEKKNAGKPIEDKAREKAVMEKVKELARSENLNPAEIEKIYLDIIAVSKETQAVTVSFQGETGAYSEEAAFRYFGQGATTKPFETLEENFKSVDMGIVQYGIVPVENSLEGSIPRTYDLLLDSNLKVSGEIILRVVHCLICLPGVRIDSIKEVYSHPQALGQCQTFLRQMGLKPIPSFDTAGSVKFIKENGLRDTAAIASARAAEIYGMKVLVKSIEDTANNYTRFFILSKHEAPPTGNDKTSLVLSVKHKPGVLSDALKELASRNINLTKIESRPTRHKPWEYYFYVDVEGHKNDPVVKEALATLENTTIFTKILGSYPAHT